MMFCFQEKFRQLLEINETVGGAFHDTNPNRELVKEGKIIKVSARDGAHLERHLFLVLYRFVLLNNKLSVQSQPKCQDVNFAVVSTCTLSVTAVMLLVQQFSDLTPSITEKLY